MKDLVTEKQTIDLSGSEKNVFCLLGYATVCGRWLEWSDEHMEDVLTDMKSSDYNHLVEVFKKHFGEYVNIINAG